MNKMRHVAPRSEKLTGAIRIFIHSGILITLAQVSQLMGSKSIFELGPGCQLCRLVHQLQERYLVLCRPHQRLQDLRFHFALLPGFWPIPLRRPSFARRLSRQHSDCSFERPFQVSCKHVEIELGLDRERSRPFLLQLQPATLPSLFAHTQVCTCVLCFFTHAECACPAR